MTHYGIAITIADNSYMGLASVSILDFDKPNYITRSSMKAFTKGKIKLPNNSDVAIEKTINGEKTIIVPGTTSCDGPTGIVAFLGDPAVYGTCFYCSECLLAQTYNLKLAEEQAEAIGEESLIGDEKTTLGYPGWYAPGVNLHRTP